MADEKQSNSTPSPEAACGSAFARHIDTYVQRLDSLYVTFVSLMPMIEAVRRDSAKSLNDFLEVRRDESEKTAEGMIAVTVTPQDFGDVKRLEKRYRRLDAAYKLLPETFIVSFVSQYDAFLGHLIHDIFCTKSELLQASEKVISISDLMKFPTIDEAKEFVIEKEVESVLRRSHAEHFEWLEGKLGMRLRSGLSSWPDFIELTERRNLFVHTDGLISSQYLAVCQNHQVKHEHAPEVGGKLTVDPRYFRRAYITMLEMGVKLGHVIWRKLLSKEIEQADSHLNKLCLEFIEAKLHDLAIRLIEFRQALPNSVSAEMALIFKINLAQAYKWKKQEEKCREILGQIDWAPLGLKFHLGRAVLIDDFDEAAEIMKRISDVDEIAYRSWPIFREFRKSDQFARTYTAIFGAPFKVETTETSPTGLLFDERDFVGE